MKMISKNLDLKTIMELVNDKNFGNTSDLDILSNEDDNPIVEIIDFEDEDVSIHLDGEPVKPVDDLRRTIYKPNGRCFLAA